MSNSQEPTANSPDLEALPMVQHNLAISIEYCVPWNYTARAAWTAQELLATFADQTASLTLIPGAAGAFEVQVDGDLVYSKQAAGRFPEMKELEDAIAARLS